jgi:hypothetical protein
METQLKAFESYIASLTEFGVHPTFQRHSHGWTCILKNAGGKQLMPFVADENCWGETIMDSLTLAVEGLNSRFLDPKQLHKYIETGIDPTVESLQNVRSTYAQ